MKITSSLTDTEIKLIAIAGSNEDDAESGHIAVADAAAQRAIEDLEDPPREWFENIWPEQEWVMAQEAVQEYLRFLKGEIMTNENLYHKVLVWAHARNLISGSTPQAQLIKLIEEVGEVARGVARADKALTIDAIGDCLVVLTILAEQIGTDIDVCLAAAYNEIKDRKGQMVDGIFIKE